MIQREAWYREAAEREIRSLFRTLREGDPSVAHELGTLARRLPYWQAIDIYREALKDMDHAGSLKIQSQLPNPDVQAPTERKTKLQDAIYFQQRYMTELVSATSAWVADHPTSDLRDSSLERLHKMFTEWYTEYWPLVKEALAQ